MAFISCEESDSKQIDTKPNSVYLFKASLMAILSARSEDLDWTFSSKAVKVSDMLLSMMFPPETSTSALSADWLYIFDKIHINFRCY